MEPVGMTKASATKVFNISTRTTTNTTVSKTSRVTSRGWASFLGSAFVFAAVLAPAGTVGRTAGLGETGGRAVVRSSAMGPPIEKVRLPRRQPMRRLRLLCTASAHSAMPVHGSESQEHKRPDEGCHLIRSLALPALT